MAEEVITIRIDSKRKEIFKQHAKKYGGMTALLLQHIQAFIEQEEEKEQRRQTTKQPPPTQEE